LKNDDDRPISARFTYVITFLLGLAFSITLMQSTWKTAIERKQKDFHFEILSIQQSVTSNVLTGNDVTNNVAAFISSNDNVLSNQFETFANDILDRYEHIEAINYYSFTGDDWVNEFRLVYESARGNNRIKVGEDIYIDTKYIDAIDTSIATRSVVPSPPDLESDPDRKYWLFKAIYSQDNSSFIKKKKYAGIVKGMVSVLVSPTKLLGDKGANSSLTITMFSDTSNLYGRQLLYFNDPNQKETDRSWKVDTLVEEKLIQLPPYSIKIIIEKDLYFTDLEFHLLLVSMLISVGILMMLYGLVSARIKQEEELKIRNAVIEQKVEEQTYELAIARDEALEAARMKSEFLASMSHEIRTPLNAIIGMSDLMSETRLTDEQSRYVGVFRKAGDALLSLVNDILDLSKIEANQLALEEIPFNIMELIEEVAEIYALKAADKDIEIISRVDTGINVNRVGDPGRLKQIILNLISNALKFTEEGEIVVTLSAENKEEEEHLIISVRDTGIGIPKDKLESIFASFTQADTSTTRKYGGTGLGLTISKRLTEMMDGKIWVESEENKGSSFYFRVALSEQTQRSIIKQDFVNKNILIIDSRTSNCLNIEDQLTASGSRCFKATDIMEAQNILKQESKPEIILIDSRLAFSEEETHLLLTKTFELDKLILLVNPKDMSAHSKLAKSNGINKILLKPIKRKELFREVNKIINKQDDSLVDDAIEDEQKEEIKAKHILLVEDNPDNRMLIKAYLKKTPHSLDEAENGSLAVEMYKKNNYDLVLMDVQMPVMDGHESTRLIRAWEKEQGKKRTVIISLTAHAIREEIDKCMAAGCDAHLSKPVKKAILLQTIEEQSSA
jgi:signal transduction histidine kinase/DNA-binding response OmpR family regulator